MKKVSGSLSALPTTRKSVVLLKGILTCEISYVVVGWKCDVA